MRFICAARRRRVSNARASKDDCESGFSLLELLIVVGIVSLLAAIATPQVLSYLGKGRTEFGESPNRCHLGGARGLRSR